MITHKFLRIILALLLLAVSAGLTATADQSEISTGKQNNKPVSALQAVDSDGDGIDDSVDNCTLIPNPNQIDSNGDGIGNWCDPDVNSDCVVAFLDFAMFPTRFGLAIGDSLYSPNFDYNSDGAINFADYFIQVSYFGLPPGPSANECVPGLGI